MAGVYLHIPFCKQKCSYCDFHFSTTFGPYRERMIEALITELEGRSNEFYGEEIETIYFGGGTPSLLSYGELGFLMNAIEKNFRVVSDPEVTLEANPDDIDAERLRAWKKLGINRLSIGIQSFRKEDLEWMNRAHSVNEATQCIALARKEGFTNFSIDLIYGLPGLSKEEWAEEVLSVIDMKVPHISAYCLTIEEKTALHSWVKGGKMQMVSEEMQSEHFLTLLELLEKSGYHQYEISNFSKEGYESKHNSSYWNAVKYIGVGPSAHSFDGSSRRWNIANNFKYMTGVEENETYFETERLSLADRFNELLLTGLRTSKGVDLHQLDKLILRPEEFNKILASFIEKDWIRREGEFVYLTPEGRLRADHIASSLFILE